MVSPESRVLRREGPRVFREGAPQAEPPVFQVGAVPEDQAVQEVSRADALQAAKEVFQRLGPLLPVSVLNTVRQCSAFPQPRMTHNQRLFLPDRGRKAYGRTALQRMPCPVPRKRRNACHPRTYSFRTRASSRICRPRRQLRTLRMARIDGHSKWCSLRIPFSRIFRLHTLGPIRGTERNDRGEELGIRGIASARIFLRRNPIPSLCRVRICDRPRPCIHGIAWEHIFLEHIHGRCLDKECSGDRPKPCTWDSLRERIGRQCTPFLPNGKDSSRRHPIFRRARTGATAPRGSQGDKRRPRRHQEVQPGTPVWRCNSLRISARRLEAFPE